MLKIRSPSFKKTIWESVSKSSYQKTHQDENKFFAEAKNHGG